MKGVTIELPIHVQGILQYPNWGFKRIQDNIGKLQFWDLS